MSLEKIGQLAVELHAATMARKNAKYDLREKYAEFCYEREICHGDQELRYVDENHPEYPAMQEYAADEVKSYARAKLTEYNLKRKLDRAVRSHGEKQRHASASLVQGDAVQDGAVC